jgi:hypothetical protein
MSIRKRNDSVKPGCGIDGRKGEDFTRQNRGDPWNPPHIPGEGINPKGHGVYTNDNPPLRRSKTDPENYDKIDILDMVESQADRTGPVRLRKRDQ